MSKFTEYFSVEGTLARCRTCKHTVSCKDHNTNSMTIHLKTHKDRWEEFTKKEQSKAQKRQAEEEKMSQGLKKFVVPRSPPHDDGSRISPSTPQSVDRSQPAVDKVYGNWSQNGLCTKKAHRALVQLIAGANLPLSLVEHPAFKNFCEALQPLYKPPSRRSLTSDHLEQLCDEYQEKIRDDMREAKRISITSDAGSTKKQKHCLLSVTAHWIAPSGGLKHCYAAVIPIRVRHTGVAFASIMDEVIDFYAPALTKEKIHLMVRDCGSNMITLVSKAVESKITAFFTDLFTNGL
ncbi:zinc finger BED domain-containing protein 4-like [Aphelenchoides avenae]|nr:zinc finger BED domain-containing protein 4-like [Aphelenchus avenae]